MEDPRESALERNAASPRVRGAAGGDGEAPGLRPRPPKTRERILAAGLALFNEQGYANTSVAQIADAAGIAPGNLWYHFHTKHELLRELFERARAGFAACLPEVPERGPALEDYVALFRRVIREMWLNRFLLRDRLQFGELDPDAESRDIQTAHFDYLRGLLRRMQDEGLFLGRGPDLDALATNLWIVLRYWGDYLQDHEAIARITRADHERGFDQHLAVLTPHLTAAARRALRDAVHRARREDLAGHAEGAPRAV